ncbi:hypothetical protein L5515_008005 [Caenorhabditis briggsae]|uniref:Uncharacterized protein n=1 Tax=Caenorhabditis briggsae TaxID=6238 RepID=A0AAE9JK91_CAEBR|nr:hypothetical protein L5515_008005 [Caenorhabditis briggsae]
MPSIQFKSAASAKGGDAQKEVAIVEPTNPFFVLEEDEGYIIPKPQFRKNRFNIRILWIEKTNSQWKFSVFVMLLLTAYYSTCFLAEYDTSHHFDGLKKIPAFSEPVLTRVIMAEWLVLAFILIFGVLFFRRIVMPLYIYLAVMATNGTLALFVVKCKQFHLGIIQHDDIAFNLVGILLFTALIHNFVYMYALYLHLRLNWPGRYRASTNPSDVSPAQEKKDLGALP